MFQVYFLQTIARPPLLLAYNKSFGPPAGSFRRTAGGMQRHLGSEELAAILRSRPYALSVARGRHHHTVCGHSKFATMVVPNEEEEVKDVFGQKL